MQNYTNYIIGGAIVLAVLWVFYVMMMPTEMPLQNDLSQNGIVGDNQFEQNISNHPEEDRDANGNTIISTTTATTSNMQTNTKQSYKLKMETNKGVILLELNPKIAPKTVDNFIKLAGSGFYNGVKFHRVIKDFMIQGGDPQSKDDKLMAQWGTGGPGYKFEDEIFDTATYQTGYKRGVLAMANSGPNTNGSQFFIMHKDVPLPPNYTIFGRVVSGIDVVDTIANVKTVPGDRPVDAVVITKMSVE